MRTTFDRILSLTSEESASAEEGKRVCACLLFLSR